MNFDASTSREKEREREKNLTKYLSINEFLFNGKCILGTWFCD